MRPQVIALAISLMLCTCQGEPAAETVQPHPPTNERARKALDSLALDVVLLRDDLRIEENLRGTTIHRLSNAYDARCASIEARLVAFLGDHPDLDLELRLRLDQDVLLPYMGILQAVRGYRRW